ncbi:hypothetical protein [Acaryochloris marina]|uniref:Uncharacterized protein n=1 Tax=Acaryochloris marina (strain MBIC 11017) TaxID=329726 RepID=B0C319_ACAM1|nr:hypothetical protein [Acaryochloris marina]ABW27366.1 hypothetical protein AM1_2356 [Acaryochloris marina MBIC11017]BDM82107.1 hypothetical protein AM10699_49710 [Acaryochloris marina MBIC10699]
MTSLQCSKQLGLAVGAIAVSSIIQATFLSDLALAEIENKAIAPNFGPSKVSLCQASLHQGSGELFDYSQAFAVPTSRPVKIATSQRTGIFTAFQTATYTEQLKPAPSNAGGFVWCKPCPYYPAPNGCWAFVGDCPT